MFLGIILSTNPYTLIVCQQRPVTRCEQFLFYKNVWAHIISFQSMTCGISMFKQRYSLFSSISYQRCGRFLCSDFYQNCEFRKGVGTKNVQKQGSFWHSLVYRSLIPNNQANSTLELLSFVLSFICIEHPQKALSVIKKFLTDGHFFLHFHHIFPVNPLHLAATLVCLITDSFFIDFSTKFVLVFVVVQFVRSTSQTIFGLNLLESKFYTAGWKQP